MNVDFAPTAHKVVDFCLGVHEGERAVVVTDVFGGHPFVDALVSTLRLRGADASAIAIPPVPAKPHGYLTWAEPTPLLEPLLKSADVAVLYMSTLLVLCDAVERAREAGTRLLFIPADFDLTRPVVTDEDYDELAALGAAVCSRLEHATKAEVRTPDGTDIVFGSISGPRYDDGRATQPGELDFFPGGMWNVIPKTDTVNGVVRFTAALHPVGRLIEPIELTFERGVIAAVGGGWQARAWERWLRSFGDAEVFEFSHLSGGLAATARVIGHDWEDLIMRGSILISGGESLLYGGENRGRAHFDGTVPDATLVLDGETVLDEGSYSPAALPSIAS